MTDELVQRLRNSPPRKICGHGMQEVKCPHCENDKLEDEIERLRGCLCYEQHRFATLNTRSDGCHAAGPMHYDCAMAEIERLTLDWVREQGERTTAENERDRGLLEIERLRAEVAAAGRRYADSESRLAECDAALQTVQAELAALRKRVEEAPVALVDRWAGGVWVLHKADLGAVCEPLRGKRARLVVEG